MVIKPLAVISQSWVAGRLKWSLINQQLCMCAVHHVQWPWILDSIHWEPDKLKAWWHQMETFSALLSICAGNSPVTGEFHTQRPVTWSYDVFFDLRLNKRLSKQSWGWWFKTPSHPLWRHCNGLAMWSIYHAELPREKSITSLSKVWTENSMMTFIFHIYMCTFLVHLSVLNTQFPWEMSSLIDLYQHGWITISNLKAFTNSTGFPVAC